MVNRSDDYIEPSMLSKNYVDSRLDEILKIIYKFGEEYNLTIEQSLNFIRNRHYYTHYHDASYQIDLNQFLDKNDNRIEVGNLDRFCRSEK